LVDTEGFVLNAFVTSAALSDQQGLFGILDNSINSYVFLKYGLIVDTKVMNQKAIVETME
jgi:hypothetical protein